MCKISIVIPAFNEENYIQHLLMSLAKQTKKDFEVVVVDGSSSDNTVAVVNSFLNTLPTLRMIVSNQANLPLQRNIGARATHGKWLVFMDADTIALPYLIERIECFIEDHNPQLFTTWSQPDSTTAGDALFTLIVNIFIESSVIFNRSVSPGPFTAVRRDVFDSVEGYNEKITFGEDYDFSYRVGEQGISLKILRETLYKLSLRRVRKYGKLHFGWIYMIASLKVLLTKRYFNKTQYYPMGGQLYKKKNSNKMG